MAIVAIATKWWFAQCMVCGFTWGPYLFDPFEEPYCHLCGVSGLVNEEEGFMMFLRGEQLAGESARGWWDTTISGTKTFKATIKGV